MKNVLLQAAMKLNRGHRQRAWWQRAVRVMMAVVVFCTTYALILPAITMEQETICGFEAHEHTQACYAHQSTSGFVCGFDGSQAAIHSHDAFCFDEQGTLICLMPECAEHIHDASCYERLLVCAAAHIHTEACTVTETVLICTEAERPGHSHDESCAVTEAVLICGKEEQQGHTHSPACSTTQQTLICQETDATHIHTDVCYQVETVSCSMEEQEGHSHTESCYEMRTVPCSLPEDPGHIHGEGCYEVRQIPCSLTEEPDHVHTEACYVSGEALICGKEEIIAHSHTQACYGASGDLVCTLEQIPRHSHTELCRGSADGAELILICGLEAHTHTELCYPVEETQTVGSEYLCASGAHMHSEMCYDAQGVLCCTIPEHQHDASCFVEDLDLNADVETARVWEATVNGLPMTGNWPRDVLTVARSQLHYQESARNVILEGEDLKGYTRYGDWYGIPYGDWCAMFVSFCLDYANVTGFPLEAGCGNWITALTEQGLYVAADDYTPKPGDIVFFDFDQREDAPVPIPVESDHVGLVAEVIPASDDSSARIHTIEGNSGDQVAVQTYELDDCVIIGYGVLPMGDTMILTHRGADYSVTVTFGPEAGIPETAELAVQEILPGTDAYNELYQESVQELLGRSASASEEELGVSFARFFDISFVADGQILEPTAAVDIQIQYADGVAMAERDSAVAVHFADDGIEVLEAEASREALEEEDQVDTFSFSQDSFSVVGTVVSAYDASLGITTATVVDFNALTSSGGEQYVLYTQYQGRYYAITSKSGDVKGYSIEVRENGDGTISWDEADSRIFWSFSKNTDSIYYVQNFGSARYLHAFDNSWGIRVDYGTTTGGRNPSTLTRQYDGSFIAQGNRYYTGISVDADGTVGFNRVTDQSQAARFKLALVGSFYNVWFDGTNGGMMSYYGADDVNIPAVKPENGGEVTITLPEVWQSSTKYPYRLQGWYDINTQTYYPVDPDDGVTVSAKISADTVFYADWVAQTYDVGQDTDLVVDSLDTNDFITTYVFDYNVLFNVLSQSHTGSISGGSHSENWSMVNSGTVPYQNQRTLGFSFVDYDSNGDFSYANGRDSTNVNQGDEITGGILQAVTQRSGQDLLELLFEPEVDVIGKTYVGTGNYLYQYMDSTTANYDGIHDGYYYLDARLNAASYNQSEKRFYLYNYLERTSDSDKDGGIGQFSDFLPFNSPYIFGEGDNYTGDDNRRVDYYEDSIRRPGWEYDAKDGANSFQEYNSTDDAATNYFFGIRSDIEFFLPNDTNSQDEFGNYGNISTRGEHMIFDFHGDDDVWVFVDGELMLDIGGLHGVMFGQIDFSTGTITTGKDGGTVTQTPFDLSAGTHNMTVYYMERGSSQSNCAIYFNIAPRYELAITKEDVFSAKELDGAEFTIYTCEACAVENCTEHGVPETAELWESFEAHREDMEDGVADQTVDTIRVTDGHASCWGLSAGTTYYIKETRSPEGYPVNDDLIRVTLNNRGTATIETTTLHGKDGEITEGFAVIKQDVNDTLKIVALTVSNQKDEDTTQIRVKKDWNGATDLPNSITAYLTVNGEVVGRQAVLSEANGWTYTWTGLPKYESDGVTPIVYRVHEVQVPGFDTKVGEPVIYDGVQIEWINAEMMEDSCTYILTSNGAALAYDGSRFYWKGLDEAKDLSNGLDAQWSVTTNRYGFRIMNGDGYVITYQRGTASAGSYSDADDYFYATRSTDTSLNQVIYFLESRLVAHDHDAYFQLRDVLSSGRADAVGTDGRVFGLLRMDQIGGTVVEIDNHKIDTSDQTFLHVNKVWEDGAESHISDSVTVRLYADGENTGRTVVLNAANHWSGTFEGLPYFAADGVTPVRYTVTEDPVSNYVPVYDFAEAEGETIVAWNRVTNLSADGYYRIVNGASALGVNAGGNLAVMANDANDPGQWWIPVTHYNRTVLKNASRDVYLHLNSDDMTVDIVTSADSASAVTLSGDGQILTIAGKYLQMFQSAVTVSEYEYNATLFMVSIRTEIPGKPGTAVTITNMRAYHLPQTGGMGTEPLTFGGILFIVISAIMFCCINGRKRRKGGE